MLDHHRALIVKIAKFALVSGIGLTLDVGLFLLLISTGLRAGYANFISASTAVTFVYWASTKRVFDYQGQFLLLLFIFYLAYQVIAVVVASWAVDVIVALGVGAIFAKGLTLPVTFTANYLFLDFLTRNRP